MANQTGMDDYMYSVGVARLDPHLIPLFTITMEVEDIDSLLDEADRMAESTKPEVKKSQSVLSNQITNLLAEIDQCDIEDAKEEPGARKVHQVSQVRKVTQCSPLLVGGSLSSPGLSSLSQPRTCDRLLCLSCNIPVITVQNMAWNTDTDYLFLRTNVPNIEKLRTRLRPSKGGRAYACHCHWRNVIETVGVRELNLPWICRKH